MSSLPHFVVIGAQKSGTTSLCAALEQVAGLCLSRPKEPMFFSRDDIELHPHFFAEQPEAWDRFDWQDGDAYRALFAHAADGDLCGEGSTSYLLSPEAARRIHTINPEAKIIAVLRDPALRAYSAYWHYVKCGIATESFANHLRYEGGLTVRGGDYARHVREWIAVFGRPQCHFILYESLLAQPEAELSRLLDFVGVKAPAPALPAENRGKTPRFLSLQLALNRINRLGGAYHSAVATSRPRPWLQQALEPLEKWNLTEAPYAPIPLVLHQRLDRYYAALNRDLPALTGLNPDGLWYRTLPTPPAGVPCG